MFRILFLTVPVFITLATYILEAFDDMGQFLAQTEFIRLML